MLCLNSSVLYTVYIFEKHSWTLVSRWRPRFTLTNILEWTQTHPWVWLGFQTCWCLIVVLLRSWRQSRDHLAVQCASWTRRCALGALRLRAHPALHPPPPSPPSATTYTAPREGLSQFTGVSGRSQGALLLISSRFSSSCSSAWLCASCSPAQRRPAPGRSRSRSLPLESGVSLWELDESLWSGEQVRQESCGSRVCLPAPSREETGESDRGVDHHGGDVPVSSHCYSTDAV